MVRKAQWCIMGVKVLFGGIRNAFGGSSEEREAIMGEVGKRKPNPRFLNTVKASVLF